MQRVLSFGADSDVTITHVADTGLILNSTRQLQFGDSGTYINQSPQMEFSDLTI